MDRKFIKSIVDNIPYTYYLVHPDTFEIVDTNDRFFNADKKCYEQIFNLKKPCCIANSECPAMQIMQLKNNPKQKNFFTAIKNRDRLLYSKPVFSKKGTLSYILDYLPDISATSESFEIDGDNRSKENNLKRKENQDSDNKSPSNKQEFILKDQEEREKNEMNEKRCELAQKIGKIGIWEWNIIQNTVFWTDETYRIFGTKKETFKNDLDSVAKLIHPADFKLWEKSVQNSIEYGSQHDLEIRIIRPDGNIRWVKAYGELQKSITGNTDILIGLITDITDKKEAEIKLKVSEEKFSKIFQNTPDAIMLTSVSDGTIIDVNQSTCKISGYSFDELIGKNSTTVNLWYDLKDRDRYVKELREKGSIQNFEVPFLTKSGEKRHGIVSGEIIELMGLPYILGIIRDVTESKKIENDLRSSEERFSKAFQANPASSVISRINDGVILHVNDSFEKISGYSRDEAIGKSANDLNIYVDKEERNKITKQLLKTGSIKDFELSFRHKSGEIRDGSISFELIEIENEKCMLINLSDITARKQFELLLKKQNEEFLTLNEEYMAQNEELIDSLERIQVINTELEQAKLKAEESDRLKSAFLANMSHEIRTPMNGILGFTELLSPPDLSLEKKQKYIEIIRQSGNRMLNIINDLIDISKIEAGQVELRMQDTSINPLVENLYEFFMPEADSKGLKLNLFKELPTNMAVISTDSTKLSQVLSNLIKNALKYTQKGSIEFGYTLKENSHSQSKQILTFYVKDTGIGIPKELMDKIFERFRQADLTPVKSEEGAGLGLSISKAYVELLGGTIKVESLEGRGSTFFFELPVQFIRRTIPENQKTENKEYKVKKGYTILVAEDDDFSYLYLSDVLGKTGANILRAKDGQETLDIVFSNPDIQLVLMDIKMPLIDGYEVTRRIRKKYPNLFIIAQTAFASEEDHRKSLEAGCNDYISKPIKYRELIEKIRKFAN
ncbi:MAG: PAS domain S-box protein [Bacteroidales bacterium]|nr:PAS domain S-box protein [Bacteroidales bacterium]